MLLYKNRVGYVYWINESSLIISGGGGGSSGTEVEDEIPTGTVDGVNGSFTIVNVPINLVKIYLNGQRLKNMKDYTFSGINITMTTKPFPGDTFIADYKY